MKISLILTTLMLFTVVTAIAAPVFHNPEAIIKEIQQHPQPGKAVYEQFCSSCHAVKPLIPLGAPALQSQRAWKVRAQQGFKVLLEHVVNGMNAMPARGGCFECTDALLESATLYLLPPSLRPHHDTHH